MLNARHIAIIILPWISSCSKNKGETPPVEPPQTTTSLVRINGTTLQDSTGKTIQLRGVAFGNDIWSTIEIPATHHSELDFERVKGMGMNAIRFYMNYKTFENDASPYQYKSTGWEWLDKNIAWAKKYGIYLVLNMHAPQGGYQSQGTGDALWTNTENQKRLQALWKAIASRYKNESVIAGFGIVNEPVPTSSIQQWETLSQNLVTEIRKVNAAHLIFAERAIYVKGANGAISANLDFPLMADNKIVYEFHFYDPHLFTHQLFDWAGTGDGGKYPDENVLSLVNPTWYTATFNNPALPAGNSGWQEYTGEKYTVTDPNIKIGMPALVAAAVGGKVYFDNLIINEYDANGIFTRKVMDLNLNDKGGWSFWSKNNSGQSGPATTTGANDNNSLYIENATDDCNMTNYSKAFEPVQGYSYQVNGFMKGENIAATAGCRFRIDFYNSTAPIYKRNKSYLLATIQPIIDWSRQKNVPLFMGEFGAGSHCFEQNKGGLQWVSDMLDINAANQISFTYHSYHEDSFGLYFGYGTLPDPANSNQPLIELFKSKLK